MKDMTPLERVLRTVRGELPDRVPVIPGVGHQYISAFTRIPLPKLVSDPNKMAEGVLATWRRHGYDAIGAVTYASLGADEMGCKVIIEDGHVIFAKEPAIKNYSDLKNLRIPDPRKDGRMPVVLECQRILREKTEGTISVGGGFQGPLSFAAILRGPKDFLLDLIRNPGFCKEVVEFSTEFLMEWGKAQIEVGGVKSLMIFEPTASPQVVSPARFEEYSFPYLRRLIAEFKRLGAGVILHICGNTKPILKKMAETGASTLSLESEVNLAEAKRITENKVCVSGNIDSFKLAFSPKEEVFQMAKACVLETSPGGRFILSSSCEVTANTPPENLDALIQAAEEYGKYR